MTQLDDAGGDEGTIEYTPIHLSQQGNPPANETSILGEDDNVQLEALRALQYEGTRAEIATGFKERGNEMVAEKRWKDAKEFYTKGILALKQPKNEVDRLNDGDKREEGELEEEQKEKQIEEACYINRALCNLELRMSSPSLLLHPSRKTH